MQAEAQGANNASERRRRQVSLSPRAASQVRHRDDVLVSVVRSKKRKAVGAWSGSERHDLGRANNDEKQGHSIA